ncbi:hypothetical protein AB0O42_05650 [Streptomyces sp. NPDC089922]|uniref:hypothetical protein n=1 Tax=Streptomyces sp. NPDC089922 TaxID=3155189 RepID=UPI003442BE2B
MTQVTAASRAYTFFFAEDIPSETYPFSEEVSRTVELDAVAKAYMNAKVALYAALNPGRVLTSRTLDYAGTVVVSETTAEGARLYPTEI